MTLDPRIGTTLAGYRIEALLGRGGMSIVYLAEHAGLERKVALRLLSRPLAENQEFRDRFVRESRLAASLDHPNIIPIYEAGEADGELFISMRYVRGSDLRRLIDDEGSLPLERTSPSSPRSPGHSTPPTGRAWSTGTSIRPTCCSIHRRAGDGPNMSTSRTSA